MNQNEIFSIAVQELRKAYPGIQGVYVFGSFASGHETLESDLDLAILLNSPIDPKSLWETAQNIAYLIQRDVDLIDLLSASTVLRFQIISTAKRIDTIDFKACDAFEDLSYSMYLRFQEERKEILKDFVSRGKILNG